MTILKMFPTIAYKGHIDIPDSVIDSYKQESYHACSPENYYMNNGKMTSPGKHKDKNYMPLISLIDEHVEKYLDYVKINKKLKCCGAWINLHTEKDFVQQHFHPNAMVSGIVYIDAPDGSAPLKFHANPSGYNIKSTAFSLSGVEGNLYFSDIPTSASEGRLFIFKILPNSNIFIVIIL